MTVSDKEWWKGAVIYQIYPRSFRDTSGNGIGDIRGIAENLEHIANLGADAIWISPFFKSPMVDFGYDVSDFCKIDPLFGTLGNFDMMVRMARPLGIKIILDLVLSHTSSQHPWFQESRKDKTNSKSDWYVWVDPKPDGSPPNNWQCAFGGPSWEFDISRGQYYLHNFYAEQPDLNLHNPKVRKALKKVMKFWIDRGVHGFRLDAILFALHDLDLKDNPPASLDSFSANFDNIRMPNDMQEHIYDRAHPGVVPLIEELREFINQYDDCMLLGEVFETGDMKLTRDYSCGNKRLHTAYNFNLLIGDRPSAKAVSEAINTIKMGGEKGSCWPSWAFSNHDVPRVASRWHPDKDGYNHDPALSKMLNAMLLSLWGTVFLYQGEELGLPSAKIPYGRLQDPWAKKLWPLTEGRDMSRTPMPWYDEPGAGFSATNTPWLPIPDEHLQLAAARQSADSDSTMRFTRKMVDFRKDNPEIETGGIEFFIDEDDDTLLMFKRELNDKKMFCMFNFRDVAIRYKPPVTLNSVETPFDSPSFGTMETDRSGGQYIDLPPYGVFYARM